MDEKPPISNKRIFEANYSLRPRKKLKVVEDGAIKLSPNEKDQLCTGKESKQNQSTFDEPS